MVHPRLAIESAENALFCRIYVSYGFGEVFYAIFILFSHFRTFLQIFRKKTSRNAYWHSSRMVPPDYTDKGAKSALFCRIYVSYGFGNPPAGVRENVRN